MSQPWCAIHTKKEAFSQLSCTYETFSSAPEAFERMVDLVSKEGYYGAYLIDDNGDCFDRYIEPDSKYVDMIEG